jgi:hypothetical protein
MGPNRLTPADLAGRERHDHALDVLLLGSEDGSPGLPSGSITVLAGYEGSEFMGEACAAARSGDSARLGRTLDARSERRRELDRGVTPEVDRTSILDSAHAIVQVSFHGTAIAEGVILDEELWVVLPFAGGSLDPAGFAASAYVAPAAASPAVSMVVVVRQPELTDLERRVFERLPREMSEMGIAWAGAGAEAACLIELRKRLVLGGRQL